jgi:hypothetical protein
MERGKREKFVKKEGDLECRDSEVRGTIWGGGGDS